MFGISKKLKTAFDELSAVLPPAADLATELMPAFGADGPKHGKDLSESDLVAFILPKFEPKLTQPSMKTIRDLVRLHGVGGTERTRLADLSEAMQLLEHAELVYERLRDGDQTCWNATQLGSATLSKGSAAVRQRILDRNRL